MLKELKDFNVGDEVLPKGWDHTVKVVEVLTNLIAVANDYASEDGITKRYITWLTKDAARRVEP